MIKQITERRLSSVTEGILSEVIQAVDDPARISGIILFGSWATATNDAASDIDLLMIQAAGPIVEQSFSVLERQVNTYAGTLSELRQRLNRDDPLNNNFILNALHEGLICLDRAGWAAALKNEAKIKWEGGPTAMTMADTASTRRALSRMLSAAKQLSERSSTSKQDLLIAEMRSHQVVIQSVYLYHRVRRRWTTGFPQMLRRLESENSFLYELWNQYVNAPSQAQRIHLASLFVASVYE